PQASLFPPCVPVNSVPPCCSSCPYVTPGPRIELHSPPYPHSSRRFGGERSVLRAVFSVPFADRHLARGAGHGAVRAGGVATGTRGHSEDPVREVHASERAAGHPSRRPQAAR